MNIFRLLGDLSHLLAILLLLHRIWKTRSCDGISGKSQLLFALVFSTRYLDIFTNFVSVYNTALKIVFLASSFATVYLMFVKFKATYDRSRDSFWMVCLLLPTALLALLVNHEFSMMEILWTFSIYLESVAILPQLFMVSKTSEDESLVSHYLFILGSYKAFYLLNWVYRFYNEGYSDLIAIFAGIVQTGLCFSVGCHFTLQFATARLFGTAPAAATLEQLDATLQKQPDVEVLAADTKPVGTSQFPVRVVTDTEPV